MAHSRAPTRLLPLRTRQVRMPRRRQTQSCLQTRPQRQVRPLLVQLAPQRQMHRNHAHLCQLPRWPQPQAQLVHSQLLLPHPLRQLRRLFLPVRHVLSGLVKMPLSSCLAAPRLINLT